jgi:hypothetical protein
MGPPATEVMKIQLEPLQKPSSMMCKEPECRAIVKGDWVSKAASDQLRP